MQKDLLASSINMADQTRMILNHYNITSPFPTEWPIDKDENDTSDDEERPTALPGLRVVSHSRAASHSRAVSHSDLRRSKSRYSVLERSGTDRRSLVPGSEKTRDGVENLVQKDEADPLGGTDSVVTVLKSRGLPVEEDQRLREHLLASGKYKLRTLRKPLPSVVNYVYPFTILIPRPFRYSNYSTTAGT